MKGIVWIESPFDSLPIEGYRKQRYWMMAEAFVRAGHRVVYWTSDFSHALKKRRGKREEGRGKGEEGRVKRDGNFRLVMIPTRPYSRNICLKRVLSHWAYARTWERMAEEAVDAGEPRPDVIIVSSPPVSTGPVGLSLARRFGAKLVVDVQDAWPETFYRLLPAGFRWAGRFLFSNMRRAVEKIYRAADLVTGVCDRYEPLVKGYGAKHYYRAYLGIERDGGKGKREEGRGKREERRGGLTSLVYVGNLGASYDLRTVVEGVRLMNKRGHDVTLDVAGFGGKVETSESVRFHGMLRQEELGELLTQGEIGIIPMKEDSFVGIPNKLGEYVAAGLKVVSSLQGETAALLSKYGCGATYRAGDVESFVRAVEAVRQLPGEAGAKLLSDELAAEKIYDGYCERIGAL